MARKELWIGALALLLAYTLNAQADRRPAADGQKERIESQKPKDVRQHAEEKSDGAAFSGKGRGGDKNLEDKDKRKGKKHHKKDKDHKGHKAHKRREGPHSEESHMGKDNAPASKRPPRADDSNSPSAPQRRPGERSTSGAEPKASPRRQ